jgi:hypothetical protein
MWPAIYTLNFVVIYIKRWRLNSSTNLNVFFIYSEIVNTFFFLTIETNTSGTAPFNLPIHIYVKLPKVFDNNVILMSER